MKLAWIWLVSLVLLTACGGAQDPISVGQEGDMSGVVDAGADMVSGEDGVPGEDTLIPGEDTLIPGEDTVPGEDATAPGEDTNPGEDTSGEDSVPGEDTTDACIEACYGFDCGAVGDCDCGTCGEDMTCEGHQCIPDCIPACNNKDCGPDGCGGECGECGENEDCWGGICVGQCEPQCDAKDCGPDNCGGSCGTCPGGETCSGGLCIQDCEPDCLGKTCGWDGCGGTCGDCPGGQWCDPDSWACETGACQLPTTFDPTQRVNELAVGDGGHPGEALDVDQDPTTCAPAGDCESGLDNQLWSLLGTLAGLTGIQPEDLLQEMVDSGDLNLLFEVRPQADAGLHLGLFYGTEANPACNPAGQVCDFWIASSSYDDVTCLPLVLFDNVVIAGTALTAGGPGYHFTLPVPMGIGDQPISLSVNRAMIEATVSLSSNGTIQSMTGVIGGAVPEQAFYDALEAIPADQFPIDKNLILGMLGMFLNADIDLDGDGTADGVSVGLTFTTGSANIIGIN